MILLTCLDSVEENIYFRNLRHVIMQGYCIPLHQSNTVHRMLFFSFGPTKPPWSQFFSNQKGIYKVTTTSAKKNK